jgi:hypothetical protein
LKCARDTDCTGIEVKGPIPVKKAGLRDKEVNLDRANTIDPIKPQARTAPGYKTCTIVSIRKLLDPFAYDDEIVVNSGLEANKLLVVTLAGAQGDAPEL